MLESTDNGALEEFTSGSLRGVDSILNQVQTTSLLECVASEGSSKILLTFPRTKHSWILDMIAYFERK